MHELPKDLTRSLRSWRGSVYGNSPKEDPTDLEKGFEDYGEKASQPSLSTQKSLVLHPTASSRGVGISRREPHDEQQQQQQQQRFAGRQDQKEDSTPARQNTTLAPQTPASAQVSLFPDVPKIDDPDPAAHRLANDKTPLSKEHFYELMGMNAPTGHGQTPKELAKQHGLFGKIRGSQRYTQAKYRIFDVATYVFIALQLLLSAVFIVLGSLNSVDSHVAIAVLGAISTVIAGALALMKGQGLPNRLRVMRDDLTNVLFEAEELYWDMAADRPVMFADICKIREDYLRVLQKARKNHPDAFKGAPDVEKGARPLAKVRENTLRTAK